MPIPQYAANALALSLCYFTIVRLVGNLGRIPQFFRPHYLQYAANELHLDRGCR